MNHDHTHHTEGLNPEDRTRIEQGVAVLMTRLTAWLAETPGSCSCDQVEILSRCYAITMFGAAEGMTTREFSRASRSSLKATRDFLDGLWRNRDLLAQLYERSRDAR
jgi:hypothetical protein